MARSTRPPTKASTPPEPPLETLARVLSVESFDYEDDVRADEWARKVRRDIDARLSRVRRHKRVATTASRPTQIPADLKTLDRAELLARLDALQRLPGVRIAHLARSELSIEDLRLLVAELEATAPTQEPPKQ